MDFMADTSDIRPKRNKPCEHCRTHRRKCILANANVCERCQRMAVPCYFKFTHKPSSNKKKPCISTSKKTYLINQVLALEQLADSLDTDLAQLQPWQVCIQRRSQHHLVMTTNMSRISDLLAWMQHQAPQRPLATTPTTMMVVTLGAMPVEQALRDMFTTPQLALPPPSSTPVVDDSTKRYLINIYFACQHLHNPLLVAPIYQPYLLDHLDDMSAWATAAYVAYSHRSCHHLQGDHWPDIGEVCFLQAKQLLDNALLDDTTPTVLWIFTAYLLAHLSLMTLQPKLARRYADLCWHMAMVQKPKMVVDTTPPTESWRRLYMAARFLQLSLNLMNNQTMDVALLALHAVDIGFPRPMPNEPVDAILACRQLCQLYHVALMDPVSMLACRLYMGQLGSVAARDVAAMEHRYVAFWYTTLTHRVSTAPLAYLDTTLLQVCPLRYLRVNITYYLGILSSAARIMPDPAHANLNNIGLPAYDHPERAILLVSVCCDAAIQIYQALAQSLPCTVEIHWLSILLETVLLLIHANHPAIRHRALQNVHTAKALLRQCVAPWPDTPQSSTSTLVNSPSPPAKSPPITYRVLLAQEMDEHLVDDL